MKVVNAKVVRRKGLTYNKGKMFQGQVYKDEHGWHVEFISSNESSSWDDESTDKKKGTEQEPSFELLEGKKLKC